jgi:hypothetical protein
MRYPFFPSLACVAAVEQQEQIMHQTVLTHNKLSGFRSTRDLTHETFHQ